MTDRKPIIIAEVYEYTGFDGTPMLQIALSNGIVTPPFVRDGDWLRSQMSLDEFRPSDRASYNPAVTTPLGA